jgi:hypothetical protein
MKKKQTIGSKVLSYIRRNPDAKPLHVARNLGVSINSVYQAIYRSKKESKLPSTTAPNAQMSLALFSDPPKKRGRPPLKTSSNGEAKNKFVTAKEMIKDVVDGYNKSVEKDNVNSPTHYVTGGIETIDYIEAKSLNYNLGNVVKYVSRSDFKGRKLEDLKKAQWYLNREIANMEKSK